MKIRYDEALQDYICYAEPMNWAVKEVKPEKDFILHITFADGSRKIFDFKPLLTEGIYKQLNNPELFKTAYIGGDTVVWNNGEIDIAPELLYEQGVTQ